MNSDDRHSCPVVRNDGRLGTWQKPQPSTRKLVQAYIGCFDNIDNGNTQQQTNWRSGVVRLGWDWAFDDALTAATKMQLEQTASIYVECVQVEV
jgi:hypothetical protein